MILKVWFDKLSDTQQQEVIDDYEKYIIVFCG